MVFMELIETIMFISLIVISLCALISFLLIHRYFVIIYRIKKRSKLFLETATLNNRYNSIFHSLPENPYASYTCNSLQTFRNNNNTASIIKFLCGYVREQEHAWHEMHSKLNENILNMKKYNNELNELNKTHAGSSYIDIKGRFPLSKTKYAKYEEKLTTKSLPKPPVTKITIICEISYTSPKGQNHYSKLHNIDLNTILLKLKNIKEHEQSIEYQRVLMSNSKRYDILKRDNFMCKICGRTASDGARLEVDHIIPVSKGGKTVDKNLQTLCRECNQGKKAKT
ncbi:MAG: HNH endonuclease [Defluviitaleaceae bacterium]|nr:HNH endonuclease [Defluviitaleaceae bacterium]